MAKKKPTLRSLRQGQTIYKVYALGERSHIATIRVLSQVKISPANIRYVESAGGAGSCCLGDCNIVPGQKRWNDHEVYYSRKKALRRLAVVKHQPYEPVEVRTYGLYSYDFYQPTNFMWIAT